METFGIEKIKKLFSKLYKTGILVKESYEDDGKISGFEYLFIAPRMGDTIFIAIKNWGQLRQEMDDLSDVERVELRSFIDGLDGVPGKSETELDAMIEEAMDILMTMFILGRRTRLFIQKLK